MDEQSIDVLVADVRARAATGEPLDNLAEAVGTAQRLSGLGDALVDHFVGEARRAGQSWSEIGAALGVTKQAAQQRFVVRGGQRQQAPTGTDGIRDKPSPFSAVRPGDNGLEVKVEIGGSWFRLVEVDGRAAADLVALAKRHFGGRWFKRLSEDLDDVYASAGEELGATADVVLADGSGDEIRRTVEVTIAKRKAAWRFNNLAA